MVADGKESIVAGTYQSVAGGLPFWEWLLSPFLALGTTGSGTVIAIIAFLLVIGGAFNAMDECGVLSYMFNRVYRMFEHQKYKLLPLVALFFMCLGAFVGSFEECVPLVPIAVALAYSLGWDALVGLFPALPGARQVILDRDLQLVVNALWAGGAEAISVGGVRIGPGVTIRQAGEAILVDNQPVAGPYTVLAIGAPERLAESFGTSTALQRLRLLETAYRVGVSVSTSDELTLPAGGGREVKFGRRNG